MKHRLPSVEQLIRTDCIIVDLTDPAAIRRLGIRADDVVYNLSAKMLSPIQVRAKRHEVGMAERVVPAHEKFDAPIHRG